MTSTISVIIFILLAPVAGCIIAGVDRIITARMQGRIGPPVLQPYYDVMKLFRKQNLTVNRFHGYYVVCYLVFVIFSGCLFFSGNDLLMVVFSLALADTFLVLAAYSTNSPYCFIGAKRELIQGLASEPILLLSAVGMFIVCKSFLVEDILVSGKYPVVYLPGLLAALLFILTIKLRKSPFDLATSHHAHQELVKGLTTEFAGPTLGYFEIAHWYESIIILGIIFLFFSANIYIGIIAVLAAYFMEILIDNSYARLKFRHTLELSWFITILLGVGNLFVIYYFINK